MRKTWWLAVVALSLPAAAFAETWEKVPLVDHMCLEKVKGDPDSHTTSCLLKCASSGYGIIAPGGTWLAFDDAGNQKAIAAIKATKKKDHVRADVSGERKGDVIAVTSLTIPD